MRFNASSGSSPLTRGARVDGLDRVPHGRIIPAHAGSTCAALILNMWVPDHPRSRGEHSMLIFLSASVNGSSPLTRGAHRPPIRLLRLHRIIPAHAGSTCPGGPARGPRPDHPRSRGEHRCKFSGQAELNGSSPLTRGAPSTRTIFHSRPRIIPAHAGSTTSKTTKCLTRADHPRSRGEHHGRAHGLGLARGSSPLTRGALHFTSSLVSCKRIIPAHAGSTGTCPCVGGAKSDHPRSRGEHPSFGGKRHQMNGSSPLTRGARAPGGPSPSRPRIIPAHAGSTERIELFRLV